jgi:hypothetical protein
MSAVEGDFDINFELEDVKVGGCNSQATWETWISIRFMHLWIPEERGTTMRHASTWFLLSRLEPYPTCQNLKSCLPYWFTTSQWRLQFPNDKVCKTITLKSIKSGVTPNKNIKVCPDWVGAKKKGRPKKAQRQLGVAGG